MNESKNIVYHTDKLIYVAVPYSHKLTSIQQLRFEMVNEWCARQMRNGYILFSPISHTHPLAEYGLPGGWDFWVTFDAPFLKACTHMAVLMLPGWEKSVGVTAETRRFNQEGKPIQFRLYDEDLNEEDWGYAVH